MHVTDNSKFLQPKDLSASHLQLAVKQSGGEGDISNAGLCRLLPPANRVLVVSCSQTLAGSLARRDQY